MQPLVIFGSSPFSVIVLEKLLASNIYHLTSVVTTPDKPTGRGLKLTPNPVKLFAQKNNIPAYISPSSIPPLNLRGGKGGVIGLVAAYGKIIPQSILDKFNNHIYNIHPSLLPKFRGPSPLQKQILDGVTQTGVTIIQLDEKMDHGPILAQQKDVILPDDTWITLGNRLFSLGANWFIENYLKIENCELKIQDESQATYTKKLTRQDGFLPWDEFTKFDYDRKFRAFYSWPGIWSIDSSSKRVKLVSLNPIMVQYAGKEPLPWRDS